MILGTIALFTNAFIVYKSISLIFLDSIDITSYKNEGEAADMIKSWVPGPLLSLTHLFSPVAYIAFSLHFYYFIKKEYKMSMIFFIISLNMPLHGLHGLSRSAPAQFILMYLFSLLYIQSSLSFKLKRKILAIGGVFIIGILSVLVIITKSRFDENRYYDNHIPYTSIIQDKTVYSIVDYLTQWNYQNIETLRNFSNDKIWYGKGSTPFATMFSKKFLGDTESYVDTREKTLGRSSSAFNGLVSTMVYDFGYVMALFFALFFHYIVRRNGPRKGYVSFASFSTFSVLISIPALSFGNNVMSALIFSIAIVYIIILNIYFKVSLSFSRSNSGRLLKDYKEWDQISKTNYLR
jgi:hypothetical protein